MADVAAILTDVGRIAIATAIKAMPNHFMGWGTGDGSWVTPPSPSVSATTLMAEIGRRKPTDLQYALPDVSGAIIVPNGKFSISQIPTRHLYYKFAFEMSEAPTAIIREQGLFVNTVIKPAVPSDTWYLTPDQILSGGLMLTLQNSVPIIRQAAVRQFYEYVISF